MYNFYFLIMNINKCTLILFFIIIFLFPLWGLGGYSLFGQGFYLDIKDENNQTKIFEKYNFKKNFTDTVSAKKETTLLIESLQEDGFLECFLKENFFIKSNKDTSKNINKSVSDTLKTTIFVGNKFVWGKLSAGNLPKEIQLAIDFKPKYFQNTPFSAQKTKKLQNVNLGRFRTY